MIHFLIILCFIGFLCQMAETVFELCQVQKEPLTLLYRVVLMSTFAWAGYIVAGTV